jgi:ADP-ribosylglycohydrolase
MTGRRKPAVLGAIAGDIIGSPYEWAPIKTTQFPLFGPSSRYTDDTVLTVAIADCILSDSDPAQELKEYCRTYPNAGYGGTFIRWAHSDDPEPYGSWGNGAAMRVSPVGWAYGTLDEVLEQAERVTAVTHNHPEGIKGAQATAAAVFLARTGASKDEIRDTVRRLFGYGLTRTLDEIRPEYQFDVSSQGTVPVALVAFLESTDFEDAVRKAVSVGGDSDTLGCITGGIAGAFYGGVPAPIAEYALSRLDDPLRAVTEEFGAQYGCF